MTPVVSEVGIFLEDLLPPGSPRVPGALRYTMARALLNVDVPPFDSLDDFSRDLARHERGNRAVLVRRALGRAGHAEIAPVPVVERRRSLTSATTLRRELREADVRLYQRRDVLNPEPIAIEMVAASAAPHRGRTFTATAACVAAGLVLIGAGELMHNARTPATTPAPTIASRPAAPEAFASVNASVPTEPRAEPAVVGAFVKPGVIVVRDTEPKPASASRPVARRVSYKRTPPRPPAGAARQRSAKPPASRSMWDRLRLGWLRNAFTSRSSL
jgi:hypothetical protein